MILSAGERDDGGWVSSRAPRLENEVACLEVLIFRCRGTSPDRPVYASEGCAALTGYLSGSLRVGAVSLSNLIHPDDRALRRAARSRAWRAGRYRIEYRIVCCDGSLKWVAERGLGSPANGQRFVDGEDVTAKVAARKRLEEAEARYRGLFENLVIGLSRPARMALISRPTPRWPACTAMLRRRS